MLSGINVVPLEATLLLLRCHQQLQHGGSANWCDRNDISTTMYMIQNEAEIYIENRTPAVDEIILII